MKSAFSWSTPRTAAQLMRVFGLNWRERMPNGVVWTLGTDDQGIRRCYYYVPNGSARQARLIARHEIDHANASPFTWKE